MGRKLFSENIKIPAYRELLVIALATIILVSLAVTTHWTVTFVQLISPFLTSPLNDILIAFIPLSVLMVVYLSRRYKEKTALLKSKEKVEADLNKAHQELQMLMQSSAAILYRVKLDADFTLIEMSNNIKQILGYSRDEVFAKYFWVLGLHPDDSPEILKNLPGLITTGSFTIDYRFKHKDGSWRWMRAQMNCLFDQQARPYEMIGTWWDISEKKKNEEINRIANERFELSFKATKNVLYDWNLVTNELWFNDEIYRSYGYDKQTTVTDLHWWESRIHPDDQNTIMTSALQKVVDKGENWSGEYRFQLADQTYANIFDRGHIVYASDGQPLRWIGSMNDITLLKKTENELKNASIESEKAKDTINRVNEDLAKKNREIEQFAYIVSHDLQEPLRTTTGFITLLQKKYQETPDSRTEKYFTYILEASERMKTLIKHLLDFSQIGNNKELQQVDCNKVLQNVISDLGLAISEAGATIEFDTLPLLNGYPTELKQLFQNLITNAIKFNKKDSSPQIRISVEEQQGYWQFAFKDNGIGIDEKHTDKIFKIFQRLHTRTEYEGSGIGLSHCKKIVELHHGNIWVQSVPGNGSTFYFTIHSPKEKINEQKIKMHNVN